MLMLTKGTFSLEIHTWRSYYHRAAADLKLWLEVYLINQMCVHKKDFLVLRLRLGLVTLSVRESVRNAVKSSFFQ